VLINMVRLMHSIFRKCLLSLISMGVIVCMYVCICTYVSLDISNHPFVSGVFDCLFDFIIVILPSFSCLYLLCRMQECTADLLQCLC
jgi:hypothetical protein